MRPVVQIAERSVADLTAETGLEPAKLRALQTNPYLEGDASLGKIVGLCDGLEAGGEYVFPLKVRTPQGEIRVLSGSTLHVEKAYRRSGLGMDLPELRWQKSPSLVALGAGLSQMALPVHQLLDYHVFLLPRRLILWKSRSVVEMKLRGIWAKLVSAVLDVGIGLYAAIVRGLCARWLKGVEIRSVEADDSRALQAVAELVARDPHPYAEVHDAAWFDWHLKESFSPDGPAQLYLAYENGRPIGFYMIKRRFHEQASHRGFRNVWLGSVIEWGTTPEAALRLPGLILSAALELRRQGCDAVEVPTDDSALGAALRKLGARTVGEGNFVIKAGGASPLATDSALGKQKNWRLRPAMGDNGLS